MQTRTEKTYKVGDASVTKIPEKELGGFAPGRLFPEWNIALAGDLGSGKLDSAGNFVLSTHGVEMGSGRVLLYFRRVLLSLEKWKSSRCPEIGCWHLTRSGRFSQYPRSLARLLKK